MCPLPDCADKPRVNELTKTVTVTSQPRNFIPIKQYVDFFVIGALHTAEPRMDSAAEHVTIGIINLHPASAVPLVDHDVTTWPQVI